jgi:N-methylhydantoinase A
VTDSDLVLGLLDPDNFLGGDMKLNASAAREAFTRLGARIDKDGIETAAGVYRIVAETMAAAARTHATDRGVDHRGIPLLAFGGAGPLHACQVGSLLQSQSVIFPPQASVLSAFGTLVSPPRIDLVRSVVDILERLDWNEVDRIYAQLTHEARAALVDAGTRGDDIRLEFGVDLRYSGQQTEISVTLPEDPRARRSPAMIADAFAAAYLAHYGVAPSHVPIEIVNWRLVALGPTAPSIERKVARGPAAPPKGHREVHLWDSGIVPVFDRHALVLDQVLKGPALIEERETTTVIPPGWLAINDASGCVIATQDAPHG